MNKSEIFVAKLGDGGKWLPLSQHLKDTGDVMEYLCRNYVTGSIVEASGLDEDTFHQVAIFCALTHDIGKATCAFQGKITDSCEELADRLAENGFEPHKLPDIKRSEMKHALAGGVILNQYFDVNESVSDIIAAHHGIPRLSGRDNSFKKKLRKNMEGFIGTSNEDDYKEVWKEIINHAKDVSGIEEFPEVPVTGQMLLTGLLIEADWIASNADFFPLFPYYRYEDMNCGRAEDALRKFNMQPAWVSECQYMEHEDFKYRFGFKPNDIQEAVIDCVNGMITPGLLIIEAPMGCGKTEAALAAAEIMSCKAGCGGVFFGLPTQATANGIFPRITSWVDVVSDGRQVSGGLAHGQARDNALLRQIESRFYDEAGMQVNRWMMGRYKALLPDFVTGTVDQAFVAALRRKFVMLLHLGLTGKTVIIDEVHSYDAYTSAFLEVMLSWLGEYHVPVILLSATLAAGKRNDLLSAYAQKELRVSSNAYPVISWVEDGEAFFTEVPYTQEPQTVSIRYTGQDAIAELISDKLSDGGCAGIIADTVDGARGIWEMLKNNLPDNYKIVLFHARFLPKDRERIEKKVLSLVGKGSTSRDKVVIVGTQVMEQSLDLDFDLLITDWCPADLLLQRIGRLHRHKDTVRPDKVKTATCYILNDEESRSRSTPRLYAPYIIRRTAEVLGGKTTISLPDDIRGIIENVYNTELGADGNDKTDYIGKIAGLKNNAESALLPCPESARFRGVPEEDMPASNGVRYGINNFDIYLLKDTGAGLETFSGIKIPGCAALNSAKLRSVMGQKLSLRYDGKFIESVKDAEASFKIPWKGNSPLKKEMFLIMDQNGTAKIGDYLCSYSAESGWSKKRV